MGRILGERPGSIQLSGAGRRASTLCSRVRAVRRYLNCDWLLAGSAIRALQEERVAGCSHRNRVHGGGRWSCTVGEADWDASVRNHPEGDLGQHASEQAGEAGSTRCVRTGVSLPSHLCVVDFGAVVGNLEIRRSPWSQAARRILCWRFIVGSIDSLKDSGLRSFGGVSPNIHQRILFHRKEGMVTRRMVSIVHRCQFRSGLFTPVTHHQLQRMPAFRVEV